MGPRYHHPSLLLSMERRALPAYSQYLDIRNKRWQYRGCGIIALKTVMDFWRSREVAPGRELFVKGIAIGGYRRGIGWTHLALQRLARRYRFRAYGVDVKEETTAAAMRHLRRDLQRGPVIASVWRGFSPKAVSSHLVVVYAMRRGVVFYHDPEGKSRRSIPRSAPFRRFAKGWKKLYIVVRPKRRRRKRGV